MNQDILQRLTLLREVMRAKKMHAYIVPGTDPHISEYIAPRWKTREWITGFDGSAGTAVITLEDAGLWTDSRYFLQAEQQLQGTGIQLFKSGLPETPDMVEWLCQTLPAESKIGLDGEVFTSNDVFRISSMLDKKKISLVTEYDFFADIWSNRPCIPLEGIFELPVEYSGIPAFDKIETLRSTLRQHNADMLILSALDEIAWTFNLRGNDVECNPVAISYAIITDQQSILFTNEVKVSREFHDYLDSQGIITADYRKIFEYIANISAHTTLLLDSSKINFRLRKAIPSHCRMIEVPSPVALLKSIKNETEIAGFRNAMIKDGVALTRFMIWLEENVASATILETTIAEKLYEFRDEQDLFVGESFATIAGYGEHGAIVHYHATADTASTILPKGFLLIDSGGQYFDGTTDITRTIALGDVTEQMKRDFTLVLKGHIALASCRFPQGTRGSQLDMLARKALWDEGYNYLHGTGHGIGHFLNVHEGPQSIRMEENPVKLQPGMVMSDEPALYRTGEYGVRHENVVLIKEYVETAFGKFYGFETLTLFPFDKTAIDKALLTEKEIQWINDYHTMVFEKLSPQLEESEVNWLKEKTKSL